MLGRKSFIFLPVLLLVSLLLIVCVGTGTACAQDEIDVERIQGGSRFLTAVEISKAGWTGATNIVLARSDDYADALAGVPLAYRLDAPILLTPPSRLDSDTLAEIKRLGQQR